MTLKRYQPARKRKRPSKKNRPLKLALALGVVGVAAGSVYLAMHGEVLVGLLNGSVDLPDGRFGRPANEQAVVAAKLAAEQGQASAPAPKGLSLKTASPLALKPKPSVAPSVAAVASPLAMAIASPKPSAFPEAGKTAEPSDEDPTLAAAPLKPTKIVEVAAKPPTKASIEPPAKPVAKATVAPTTKPTAAPVAKASPAPVKVAVAAKPVVAKATAQPSPAAKPAVKVAAKPTAKSTTAPAKAASRPKPVRRAAGQGASLYFDKNSSYLSGAEQQRLAQLAASLKQKGGTIHVTGFADSVGDAKYNRWMAERRAARVAELLRAQSGGRVNVVIDAVGSVGAATGPEGEARNRRVEIQVR